MDFSDARTLQTILEFIRVSTSLGVDAFAWVSIPCRAGCRWRHPAAARGVHIGHPMVTNILINNGVVVCRAIGELGGRFAWEWPLDNYLWKDARIIDLMFDSGAVLGFRYQLQPLDLRSWWIT